MKRIHGFSVEGAKRKKRTFSFIKKLLRSMIKCVSKSYYIRTVRNSPPEVFIQTVVLKICSKFTRAHPYRSVISIKLQSNFIEIILRHGCSPVHLLHVFRTPFSKNISGHLLLLFYKKAVLKNSCVPCVSWLLCLFLIKGTQMQI